MDISIIEVSCYKCGVSFWLTQQYDDQLRDCHNDFYCPNGHAQHYVAKSEAEKAKEELSRYKHKYEIEKSQKESLNRSNIALRGVITRQKNKAG